MAEKSGIKELVPASQGPPNKLPHASQPAELGVAHRRELPPAALLRLEPRPLSAFDDNPVLNDTGAAFILGVTAECLKKWRQRRQGPDYIQYGPNGPVRYELNALMEFRDRYRIKPRGTN